MPRPGPRPYECVRRAWHSDRHQPIRGSLIQEIFRLVNEVHSSSTRKNREWQEKLPIVVLKAEEIIYSKANSESEYSDLKTLWERVNDAINTIIRRDETTETGELLQPCIEAALHLGCTPKRSSRSQRNECPRYYLRPEMEPVVPTSQVNGTPLLLHFSHYSSSDASGFQGTNCPWNSVPLQSPLSSISWSIYPLCDPKLKPCAHQETHSSAMKLDSSSFVIPSNHEHASNRFECDLTLRLGS